MTFVLSFDFKRAGLAAGAFFFILASEPKAADTLGANTISGTAVVIDGDTIDVAGERIRLEGIDAPELAQSCQDQQGANWNCGRQALKHLLSLTTGQQLVCDKVGTDKYARTLAICFANGVEINADMVRTGFARAFVKYSARYVAEEKSAEKSAIGIWQGPSVAPWDFRQGEWQSAEVSAPSGCAIKGNVSRRGMVYHVPWSPWYGKVKVDVSRGERWFCSEADAIAAGWRAASTN